MYQGSGLRTEDGAISLNCKGDAHPRGGRPSPPIIQDGEGRVVKKSQVLYGGGKAKSNSPQSRRLRGQP